MYFYELVKAQKLLLLNVPHNNRFTFFKMSALYKELRVLLFFMKTEAHKNDPSKILSTYKVEICGQV